VKEVSWRAEYTTAVEEVSSLSQRAIDEMEAQYEPPDRVSAPMASDAQSDSPLSNIFRDVDD
jgi:hypothetical protein